MSPRLSSIVAANIRAEMARQKVSQAALAERLGISQAAVSRRLAERSPFELDEVETCASVLNVPVARLMREDA